MPGSISDDMAQLLDQLRTNAAMQQDFLDNPSDAVAPFELTPHERDAIVTKDCDDLVALGVTNLPDVLGCPKKSRWELIQELLAAWRDRIKELFGRGPKKPDIDEPQPPFPPPGPGPIEPPGPGPRPGPGG